MTVLLYHSRIYVPFRLVGMFNTILSFAFL